MEKRSWHPAGRQTKKASGFFESRFNARTHAVGHGGELGLIGHFHCKQKGRRTRGIGSRVAFFPRLDSLHRMEDHCDHNFFSVAFGPLFGKDLHSWLRTLGNLRLDRSLFGGDDSGGLQRLSEPIGVHGARSREGQYIAIWNESRDWSIRWSLIWGLIWKSKTRN